jgi:microcystin-dependent protein
MADPFVGEIRMFGGNFAPQGWALCNGQLLSISQNTALFSLLGTNFGGDGRTTFGLPDLRGRAPIHMGQGNGLTPRSIGYASGRETVALTTQECPPHSHIASGASGANQPSPVGNFWSTDPNGNTAAYSTSANSVMSAGAVGTTGPTQPHDNMQPYLAVNYIIALAGVFPPRN